MTDKSPFVQTRMRHHQPWRLYHEPPIQQYVDIDRIPAEVLAGKQAEFLADESIQKKPENIRPQIVEGQLKKWYSQVVLYEQPFRDEERTVRELVNERIATIGENIRVRRFTRYALGGEL